MKNTGNRLPSCSCFFFAYLAKKKIMIIAIIIVVKKTSKFVQIGAGVYNPLIVIKDEFNNIGASSSIGKALNAAKYQKKICNNKGIFLKNSM